MKDLAALRRRAWRVPERCSELSEELRAIWRNGSRQLRSSLAPAAATKHPNARLPQPLPVAAGKRSHDCIETRTFPTSAAGFADRGGVSPTSDAPEGDYADRSDRAKTKIILLAGIGTVSTRARRTPAASFSL